MMLAVVVVLVLLALVGHGYVWMGAVNRIHAWAGPRVLVDLATLICEAAFVALPVLVAWQVFQTEAIDAWIYAGSPLSRYSLFCAAWGTVKTLLAQFGPKAADRPSVLLDHQAERLDLSDQLSPKPLVGWYPRLLGAIPGNEVLQLSIDRKRLAVARLRPEHEGLTIAHISDLHMTGRICEKYFELAAEHVNRLEPDVVVLTGDIVEKQACLPWLANSLGQLRARIGVYFVLGNHDAFIDANRTRQMLQDLGLIPVANRCLTAQWNDAPVELVGNECPWFPSEATFGCSQPKQNVYQNPSPPTEEVRRGVDSSERPDTPQTPACKGGGPENDPQPLRVALVHTPDRFDWAQQVDADLVFAGHTHGGQVCLPVLGAVASPSFYGTRYAGGVFRAGHTTMHVTRGLSGKTPLRWNCPPEIALLTLAHG